MFSARFQGKWKLRRICRTIFANKRQIVWMAVHPEGGDAEFCADLFPTFSHVPQSTDQNWLVNKDGINNLCFIPPKEVNRHGTMVLLLFRIRKNAFFSSQVSRPTVETPSHTRSHGSRLRHGHGRHPVPGVGQRRYWHPSLRDP